MNPKRVVALWLLHRRMKRRQIKRKYWIHPIINKREQLGTFYTLYNELRHDENKFFNFFRMSTASFDELHNKLQDFIKHENTKMRNCIPSEERLALTLR